MRNEILTGNALEILPQLPDATFQCCVTSPPYYGLRDYGTRRWFGGVAECDHDTAIEHGPHHPGQVEQTKWKSADAAGNGQTATTAECSKCGAWYGQLGLEPTPEKYVEHMVLVFREVRRVLRDDGVLWLNLGDSYANDSKWGGRTSGKHAAGVHGTSVGRAKRSTGLKSKDLIGIPWMVAFALREDGWYLRSDIIWAKGNCMPESVKDRPTKGHEYVFMLSKSPDYFYDAHAIREPASRNKPWAGNSNGGKKYSGVRNDGGSSKTLGKAAHEFRQRRTVWTINTKPYSGAHFAVMPEELARLCIEAGSSEKGCCSECGAPWIRIFETGVRASRPDIKNGIAPENRAGGTRERDPFEGGNVLASVPRAAIGWEPSCICDTSHAIPCLVLDPFSGAGTTAVMATRLGRSFVGIELNPSYVQLSTNRIAPVATSRQQADIVQDLLDT